MPSAQEPKEWQALSIFRSCTVWKPRRFCLSPRRSRDAATKDTLSRPSLAVGWRDVRLLSGCRAALERTWIVYFQVQPSASPFPTEYPPFSGAPGAPVSVRRGKSMETKAEKPGAACQVMCGLGLTAAYWRECDYLAPIRSHSIFSTPVSCDIIFTVLLS